MPILESIQNFTRKPVVQGILGAAAFGANPLVGLLAGPGIASARDRRALENEALREEIANSQSARDQKSRQNAAASKVANLLGHDPLMEDVGELSILNPQQRTQRAQDKRGELAEIAGILSPQGMGQALAGSILPGEERTPAFLDVGRRLGFSEDRLAELWEAKQAPETGDSVATLMASYQLEEQRIKNEIRQQEQQEKALKKLQDKKSVELSVQTDFRRVNEINQLQKVLQDTWLAAGFPAGEQVALFRSFLAGADIDAFGIDPQQERALLTARGRLKDLLSQSGVLTSVQQMKDLGVGNISDVKFKAFNEMASDITKQPGANMLFFADQLEAALDSSQIGGVTVPNETEMRKWIEEMRASTTSGILNPGVTVTGVREKP